MPPSRFIVLGAGLQGNACAYDLQRSPEVEGITLVDRELAIAAAAAGRSGSDKVKALALDCSDEKALAGVLSGHRVAISTLPPALNLTAARAAIAAKVHLVDLGGNTEVVLGELLLNKAAREAGVTVVPDCGLSPGLSNVLVADAARELQEISDVRIRAGRLPARPVAPWKFLLLQPFESVLNSYTGSSATLRDWNRSEVEALSDIEPIAFPDPVGECEAAFTSGGSSTLPWTFAGRIRNLDFKAVCYPGHFGKVLALKALGLLDTKPVDVDGARVSPRRLLSAVAAPRLCVPGEPDLVVLRVESIGKKDGKNTLLCHELMDMRDEETGFPATARTAAFTASIVAQNLAEGVIERRGVFPPEKVVSPAMLLSELERRCVFVRRTLVSNNGVEPQG